MIPKASMREVVRVFVTVSCPVASCTRNVTLNGIGRCICCGTYLIAKPSPRRKSFVVTGPTWRWHTDPQGQSTIMVTDVTWDDHWNRERSFVEEERGYWTPVHEPVIRLHPDRRRASHAVMPWHREMRASVDPRRQAPSWKLHDFG